MKAFLTVIRHLDWPNYGNIKTIQILPINIDGHRVIIRFFMSLKLEK